MILGKTLNIESLIDAITTFFGLYTFQLVISIVVVLVYLIIGRLSILRLQDGADQGNFKEGSAQNAVNLARLLTGFIGLLTLALVWGVKFSSIFVFAGTTLTLLGVALFASWSILSNVTSYFVLLLHPSFRRGTFIRIIDADNYAEGYIAELSMFNTKLITENREVIVYPNNLLLSRPALINPRDKLNTIGKLPISKSNEDVLE